MARGVDGRSIFQDDADRLRFMTSLREEAHNARASLLAYCLMDNHFHLLMKVEAVPLSAIMHRILTRYALTFNMRHGRAGHLFQARYKAIVVLDERYLARLVSYIHENPVRKGMAPAAGAWPWSSARVYAGLAHDVSVERRAMEGLLGETTDPDPEPFDPWHAEPAPEPVLFRSAVPEWDDRALFEACVTETGRDSGFLRNRCRDRQHFLARKRFVDSALRRGIPPSRVARWLGITQSSVHHLTRREISK